MLGPPAAAHLAEFAQRQPQFGLIGEALRK
jgi:hypothetical protein